MKLQYTINSKYKLGIEGFKNMLLAKNFDELGEGAYSTVFGRVGDNTVVKVGAFEGHLHRTTKDHAKYGFEDAYLDYLDAAANHPGNPFFPLIKDVVIFTSTINSDPFYVVILERLAEYSTANKKARLQYNAISDIVGIDLDNFFDLGILLMKSPVVAVLKVLTSMTRRHSNDLHTGNIMIRENGQLVITDPVS